MVSTNLTKHVNDDYRNNRRDLIELIKDNSHDRASRPVSD